MSAPQAAMLFNGAVAGGDPDISFVVNLSHFDGANGAGSYPATIGPSFFSQGPGPVLDTSIKALGSASLFIPGTGVRSLAIGTEYAVGTNDYCYEFFFHLTTMAPSVQVLMDGRQPFVGAAYPVIVVTGGGVLVDVNGSTLYSGGSLSTGVMYFMAHCRIGTTAYLYLGTQGSPTAALLASATDSTNYGNAGQLLLGVSSFSSFPLSSGYMDEFRFTNGAGRYGGATIPIPVAEFPNF